MKKYMAKITIYRKKYIYLQKRKSLLAQRFLLEIGGDQ